jgi:two-component system response regulator DegU
MPSLLIIDDNREMRQLIRHVVAKVSDEIFECNDGAGAVPAYAKHRPDWVLMDVEMAQMDGIQATRDLTREFPGAQVIILTNYNDAETRAASAAAGAAGFLSKDNLLELRAMLKPDVKA